MIADLRPLHASGVHNESSPDKALAGSGRRRAAAIVFADSADHPASRTPRRISSALVVGGCQENVLIFTMDGFKVRALAAAKALIYRL